jgi:hypothetical protein
LSEPVVSLTKEECHAIFELIDQLSGGNPENAFANDGSDSMDDPTTPACVKIYKACGRSVPGNLE